VLMKSQETIAPGTWNTMWIDNLIKNTTNARHFNYRRYINKHLHLDIIPNSSHTSFQTQNLRVETRESH